MQTSVLLENKKMTKLFFEAYNDMLAFLQQKTNVRDYEHRNAEADDYDCYLDTEHPDDNHIIVSSDSDFLSA